MYNEKYISSSSAAEASAGADSHRPGGVSRQRTEGGAFITCVNFTIPRLLRGLDLPVPGPGVLLQGAEDEGLPVLPRGGAMGGAHGFHRDNLNIESLSQAGVTITDLVALAEHHRFDWTKIGASRCCADIVSLRVCAIHHLVMC